MEWKFWVILWHKRNNAVVIVNHYTDLTDATNKYQKLINRKWDKETVACELLQINEYNKPTSLYQHRF